MGVLTIFDMARVTAAIFTIFWISQGTKINIGSHYGFIFIH